MIRAMVIPSQAPPPGKPLLKMIWVGFPQFQVGSVPWSTLGQPPPESVFWSVLAAAPP